MEGSDADELLDIYKDFLDDYADDGSDSDCSSQTEPVESAEQVTEDSNSADANSQSNKTPPESHSTNQTEDEPVRAVTSLNTKSRFHAVLQAAINAEQDSQEQVSASASFDLLDDVYSLDTEKEKQHRKELFALRKKISDLRLENEKIRSDKEQLQHNLALLLVTAKKELATERSVSTHLRKEVIELSQKIAFMSKQKYMNSYQPAPRLVPDESRNWPPRQAVEANHSAQIVDPQNPTSNNTGQGSFDASSVHTDKQSNLRDIHRGVSSYPADHIDKSSRNRDGGRVSSLSSGHPEYYSSCKDNQRASNMSFHHTEKSPSSTDNHRTSRMSSHHHISRNSRDNRRICDITSHYPEKSSRWPSGHSSTSKEEPSRPHTSQSYESQDRNGYDRRSSYKDNRELSVNPSRRRPGWSSKSLVDKAKNRLNKSSRSYSTPRPVSPRNSRHSVSSRREGSRRTPTPDRNSADSPVVDYPSTGHVSNQKLDSKIEKLKKKLLKKIKKSSKSAGGAMKKRLYEKQLAKLLAVKDELLAESEDETHNNDEEKAEDITQSVAAFSDPDTSTEIVEETDEMAQVNGEAEEAVESVALPLADQQDHQKGVSQESDDAADSKKEVNFLSNNDLEQESGKTVAEVSVGSFSEEEPIESYEQHLKHKPISGEWSIQEELVTSDPYIDKSAGDHETLPQPVDSTKLTQQESGPNPNLVCYTSTSSAHEESRSTLPLNLAVSEHDGAVAISVGFPPVPSTSSTTMPQMVAKIDKVDSNIQQNSTSNPDSEYRSSRYLKGDKSELIKLELNQCTDKQKPLVSEPLISPDTEELKNLSFCVKDDTVSRCHPFDWRRYHPKHQSSKDTSERASSATKTEEKKKTRKTISVAEIPLNSPANPLPDPRTTIQISISHSVPELFAVRFASTKVEVTPQKKRSIHRKSADTLAAQYGITRNLVQISASNETSAPVNSNAKSEPVTPNISASQNVKNESCVLKDIDSNKMSATASNNSVAIIEPSDFESSNANGLKCDSGSLHLTTADGDVNRGPVSKLNTIDMKSELQLPDTFSSHPLEKHSGVKRSLSGYKIPKKQRRLSAADEAISNGNIRSAVNEKPAYGSEASQSKLVLIARTEMKDVQEASRMDEKTSLLEPGVSNNVIRGNVAQDHKNTPELWSFTPTELKSLPKNFEPSEIQRQAHLNHTDCNVDMTDFRKTITTQEDGRDNSDTTNHFHVSDEKGLITKQYPERDARDAKEFVNKHRDEPHCFAETSRSKECFNVKTELPQNGHKAVEIEKPSSGRVSCLDVGSQSQRTDILTAQLSEEGMNVHNQSIISEGGQITLTVDNVETSTADCLEVPVYSELGDKIDAADSMEDGELPSSESGEEVEEETKEVVTNQKSDRNKKRTEPGSLSHKQRSHKTRTSDASTHHQSGQGHSRQRDKRDRTSRRLSHENSPQRQRRIGSGHLLHQRDSSPHRTVHHHSHRSDGSHAKSHHSDRTASRSHYKSDYKVSQSYSNKPDHRSSEAGRDRRSKCDRSSIKSHTKGSDGHLSSKRKHFDTSKSADHHRHDKSRRTSEDGEKECHTNEQRHKSISHDKEDRPGY